MASVSKVMLGCYLRCFTRKLSFGEYYEQSGLRRIAAALEEAHPLEYALVLQRFRRGANYIEVQRAELPEALQDRSAPFLREYHEINTAQRTSIGERVYDHVSDLEWLYDEAAGNWKLCARKLSSVINYAEENGIPRTSKHPYYVNEMRFDAAGVLLNYKTYNHEGLRFEVLLRADGSVEFLSCAWTSGKTWIQFTQQPTAALAKRVLVLVLLGATDLSELVESEFCSGCSYHLSSRCNDRKRRTSDTEQDVKRSKHD